MAPTVRVAPTLDVSTRKVVLETSRQDGDLGRYTVSPHTIKRRTTTNLKTKTNQNCQEIELYGSLTIKELKKKHLPRPVGGAEMGSWSGEDSSKGSGWRTWAGKVVAGGAGGRNNWGVRQTAQPRVPAWGNKASKPLTEKTCGHCGGGRNSQPHRRVCWRHPQGPRMYTNPPTQESAPEGPN